ncbi:MAG TPA: hypothetical protein DCE56_06770 [Cyanobacteria bacterium UBA8553]|nr:hypothetical protein [Cyanobacteria bacterium UBA8553]HAJ60062.1 hypothetical protein [Cyanobacteria bacterium UBA8543]
MALVKDTRKRLDLTQLQFAQALGVSFHSVNRWERSKISLNLRPINCK